MAFRNKLCSGIVDPDFKKSGGAKVTMVGAGQVGMAGVFSMMMQVRKHLVTEDPVRPLALFLTDGTQVAKLFGRFVDIFAKSKKD